MDIDIKGAKILFVIFGIKISQIQVVSWLIIFLIFLACFWMTYNMKTKAVSRKQIIAEYIVNTANKFVLDNMGRSLSFFSPFILAIMLLSLLSTLSELVFLKPPTSDLNTILGWSILVFFMIIYYKVKTQGIFKFLKSYTEPIAVLTPFNLISDIAIPISMAFRHFGNVVSGIIVVSLVYSALASLSGFVLSGFPIWISNIPIFQLGIPVVLLAYFDLFGGVLQAFIFCMLTMIYIKMATEQE